MPHPRRRPARAEPRVLAREQLVERAVELHRPELEPRLVGLEARDGPHELDEADALLAPLQKAQRALHVGGAHRLPAPVDLHDRALRRRERAQLLVAQLRVADREPPIERRQHRGGQEAAGLRERLAAGGHVRLQPGRRAQPRRRERDRHVAPVELRHQVAQEVRDRLGVELHRERLLLVELDPLGREERAQLRQLALEVAGRITRAHERERVVAGLPEQGHRQAQRRVVVGVQPQLERERAARSVVEVQAEPPRRLLHLGEPVVDPARQATLEPGVARVLRQLRIGRRQPGEERVDRGAPADPRRVAELHARGDEPVARDLVDELRVEVGDRRLAVLVEALGADERQRARDLRERALDVIVERRAPERVPAAAAARQLRMHHPLGDRAARDGDEREENARAVAELEVGRRLGELEQLGHREQPRVHLMLEHVHRRGLARAQAAVRERLAVTRKRIRAGATPDHFERKHDLTE